MDGQGLTGQFRVRMFRPALDQIRGLVDRVKEGMEIRRHILKLRYWPENHPQDGQGQLLDLNWSWIRALRGAHVGELRIDDTIAGNENSGQ